MTINIFIALSASAKNAVNERLHWVTERDGEYTGNVTNQEYRIFKRMAHHKQTGDMWLHPTFLGKTWTLYNLDFNNPSRTLQKALDFLADNRANLFRILGAFRWDAGLQVGLSYDENGDVQGTPTYPIPAQLLSFMPDVEDDSDPLVMIPATELAQVNKVQGQADRIFS